MTWYYVKDGEAAGPISDEDLISKLRIGSVLPTTLVWRSGMSEWEPASKVVPQPPSAVSIGASIPPACVIAAPPELAAGPPPVLPIFFCTYCGMIIPADQLVRISARNVCGACKPLYVQQISEGVETSVKAPIVGRTFEATLRTPGSEFADPWIRLVAHILDLVFIAVPIMVAYFALALILIGIAAGGVGARGNAGSLRAFPLLLTMMFFIGSPCWVFFYWTFFLGRGGATPAMKIMKLRMVRSDRGPVDYGRAFGRAILLYLINAFTMSLTNITAFFDRERRTVVDMICDTRVVRS